MLEDAKVYSEHSNKTEIDESDIRLAIQNRLDHSFTTPPPREVCTHTHREYNHYFFIIISCALLVVFNRNCSPKEFNATSTYSGEVWATPTTRTILFNFSEL